MVDGFIWVCFGIYGPNGISVRGQMWDELVSVQQYLKVPWCCIGDFNIIHFPSERLGGSHFTPAMDKFLSSLRNLV